MLLLLAFEKEEQGSFSFEDQITVSKNASGMGGSQVYLESNKIYSAQDLIKSIIIASANDASVAIAEHLYGNEENAVDAMNNRAKQLGMTNTLFSNCTGLMKPTQYSCARDVAVMLSKLIKYEKYFDYSKIYTDSITHDGGRETSLTNTNKLVRFYNGCDGGKTGFTNEAGYCLAATAKRGNTRVISVLIKECDSKTRFADCSNSFNYAFENFMAKEVLSKGSEYDVKVKVASGKTDYVKIGAQRDFYVFGYKNDDDKITVEFEVNQIVKAPVNEGDVLGKFYVYKKGVLVGEVDAVSLENIDQMQFLDYVNKIARG
ncbi:MAG: D-alanyl-D-alanine carboxypeptidase [Clostridia bacterium]|nr:D-alanyl-D-alanine carboxypeptidase [Clostridia bacterium]